MLSEFDKLRSEISTCTLCSARFAKTVSRHEPRPVFWARPSARILIAGQAPGAKVHASGIPFDDASGDRLRGWMGVTKVEFYDRDLFAILPMGFCFPGYDARGADLPPPRICAATWRKPALDCLEPFDLMLLVGGLAQKWHLGTKNGVTKTVATWRDHAPHVFPLPHPSWRNTGWLKKNHWFENDLLPVLRAAVAMSMKGNDDSA